MTDYQELTEELQAISADVKYDITVLSNAAALLYDRLDRLNWAGFYLMRGGRLILGPFNGKVACTEIEIGKGVCGTAVKRDSVIVVKDVHTFDGHIACDSASNSEIVLPLHVNGQCYGVLDIDSPVLARFTEEDAEGLKKFAAALEKELGHGDL